MGITESTYYGFSKLRDASPESQDWSVTDHNWEIVSKLLKAFENHTHTGASGIQYPGYNSEDVNSPTLFTLTEGNASGGVLGPGTTVGVRLSYVDSHGLETAATQEIRILLSSNENLPDAPAFVDITPAETGGVSGGTYIYGVTLGKGSGETILSDTVLVDIPFDGNYNVNFTVDSLTTLGEGAQSINFYRSTGLSSNFQKVGTITDVADTTFTDTNNIAEEDLDAQPPVVSTFDANRSVTIDWSDLTPPTGASYLRVYVTPDDGIWGTSNLLEQIDLTEEDYAESTVYLGSQSLAAGWPKDTSQTFSAAPKINLTTQAEGGLDLTAVSDFNGFAASNFKVGGTPTTPENGMIWYDSNALRARVNDSNIVIGTVSGTLDWTEHESENAGGHIADNIPFKASSTVSVKDILDVIVDSEGARTNVQPVTAPPVGSETTTSSTSFEALLTASSITREFASQWVEVSFSTDLLGPTLTSGSSTITFALAVGGVTIDSTQRSLTTITTNDSRNFNAFWAVQLDTSDTVSIEVLWKTDGNTWTAVEDRRQLYVKQVY